jgi:Na+/H+-dicarboxylate symporter
MTQHKEWKVCGLVMWQQVMLALVLGVLTGWALGEDAGILQLAGTIFLKLIKMVVAPLILFALIAGITSLSESHHFRGIAIKGTVAYLVTSLMAVSLGLILGGIFKPGSGVSAPEPMSTPIGSGAVPHGLSEFLMSLIPGNVVHSMADDLYLQIVLFAIFTGIVMNNISGQTDKVKELNQQLAHIVFKMIEWIVRLAPLAVFGFMAAMVGTTGSDVIFSLTELVALVIGASIAQVVFFGLLLRIVSGLSPVPFFRKMVTTQVMAFSTSSSKATLTTAMRELQDKLGVSRSSCNFMMPLGACINMDGTAIYLGVCTMFFAQMYGIDLQVGDYLVLMLTCTLGSIGAAGIPSGSIIFMGMVLGSVGIPMEGIALLLGVDRILDMFRTTVNITGDSAITLMVDHSEKQLDVQQYYAEEERETPA